MSFGTYPQTAKGNGKTPIEWQVQARSGKYALPVSRYALDCQKHTSAYVGVTWEKCSPRTWPNGSFMQNAFTGSEQAAILKTTADNGGNHRYPYNPTGGGKQTQDKVLLLSYAEAQKYFDGDALRRCLATAYAQTQGATLSNMVNNGAAVRRWLRSTGRTSYRAPIVNDMGSPDYNYSVSYTAVAVRPAV